MPSRVHLTHALLATLYTTADGRYRTEQGVGAEDLPRTFNLAVSQVVDQICQVFFGGLHPGSLSVPLFRSTLTSSE